jgi:uncharacterized membrane protein
MLMAARSNNAQAVYVTTRHVVLADWLFTLPAVVISAFSGGFLMLKQGYSFTSPWFIAVIAMFGLIGLCWLPVLRIQYRLRAIAKTDAGLSTLSPAFNRLMKIWACLGFVAFGAILVLFYLMVFKPLPLG